MESVAPVFHVEMAGDYRMCLTHDWAARNHEIRHDCRSKRRVPETRDYWWAAESLEDGRSHWASVVGGKSCCENYRNYTFLEEEDSNWVLGRSRMKSYGLVLAIGTTLKHLETALAVHTTDTLTDSRCGGMGETEGSLVLGMSLVFERVAGQVPLPNERDRRGQKQRVRWATSTVTT
jgi:hypothetical protein